MTGNRAILIAVTDGTATVDVCVDADVPAFQLVPSLLALVGRGATPVHWHLLDGSARLVPPRATLATAGVVDGDTVTLREGSGRAD